MHQNICFCFLKRSFYFPKLFHTSGSQLNNHYETLKLKNDCTQQDIRDSFLKLSKEHHPDINKHPQSHTQFLKIQEAYHVLGKPESRANYDHCFSIPRGSSVRYAYSNVHANPRSTRYGEHGQNGSVSPWDDPFFYHNRDRSQDAKNASRPYYGIRGIKKVSNGTIAFICVVVGLVSFIVQMFGIRYAYFRHEERVMSRTMEYQAILNELKEKAKKNGNARTAELLQQQFEEIDRQRAERHLQSNLK